MILTVRSSSNVNEFVLIVILYQILSSLVWIDITQLYMKFFYYIYPFINGRIT